MGSHRGQVMHICFSKLTIVGSDNDLSPGQLQAIIWTEPMQTLGTKFYEILREIQAFSYKKMSLKMSTAKCR